MQKYLAAFLILKGSVLAGEWVVIEGGQSPDKKLAVAVFPQKGKSIDEASGTVLLVDQVTGKKIGPLEEVDSTGGTWGATTENVHCEWSADSSLLIVNFRTGRLMQSSQIYRFRGQRAIPVELPNIKTHPKARIYEVLTHSANPGSEVTLAKDGTILQRSWGLMPKEGHFDEDYSKYGLKGFEGTLLFHYRLDEKGQLQLKDITVPSP
jgi:hypothetical protein